MEERRGYQPLGFVLNFHKYYNPPIDYFKKTADYISSCLSEHQSFTTFGNFDQMSFSPVNAFTDYRENCDDTYTWLGNRQGVLLYPISATNERCFGFFNNQFGLVDRDGLFSDIKSNYLLVTLLYTSGGAKASVKSYDCFLRYCKDAVYGVARAYNEKFAASGRKIECEVFGTFNSAELAVLWTANEFTDVLYLIDNLRYLTLNGYDDDAAYRAFISSHTFVALSKMCNSSHASSVKGGALIQLAGRTSAGVNQDEKSGYEAVTDYVRGVVQNAMKVSAGQSPPNYMFCAGEYDLILKTDQKFLPVLFPDDNQSNSNQNFSIQNEEYCKHILESTTRLYYSEDDIKEIREALSGDWRISQGGKGLLDVQVRKEDQSNQYSPARMEVVGKIEKQSSDVSETQQNNFTLFRKLCRYAEKIFQPTTNFLYTLELAYIDYVQCVTTAVDHLWVKDFDIQFHAALTILLKCGVSLEESIRNNNRSTMLPSKYVELVLDVFHALEQQCYHVVDSGKFFFEEPRSHFNYTGQYDLIMHAYYGILKCLLERLYWPGRPQSLLYPLINFESAPILSSRLYFEDMEDTPADSPTRLLVIRLPYNAWTSLDHYVPMLIHELYHYAAPRNRIQRNYYFGCILMTWLHTRILEWVFENLSQQYESNDVSAAVILLTNRAQEILAEEFGVILHPSGKSKGTEDCFRGQYTNYLLRLLEDNSNHYSKILKRVLDALAKGLSTLQTKDEWQTKFHLMPLEGQETLNNFLNHARMVLQPVTIEDKDQFLSSYRKLLNEEIPRHWEPILQTLKELFPDVAMVALGGLDAVGYLLQFSIYQNNQLMTPKDMQNQNSIRIGCILDWILGCLPSTTEPDGCNTLDYCLKRLEELHTRFMRLYQRIYSSNDNLGEDWFCYYRQSYKLYLESFTINRRWLDQLIHEEFLPCLRESNNSDDMRRLTQLSKNYYNILEEDSEAKRKKALFDHTIEIVQSFQVQKSLDEIDRKQGGLENTSVSLTSPSNPILHLDGYLNDYRWQRKLGDSFQLHSQLTNMIQQLRMSHQKVFPGVESYRPWFRGCRNATFDILPSIMVHFLDGLTAREFNGKNSAGLLLDYQRKLLEEFKFRADGAPELLNSTQFHRLDYLSLMQHYGQYTGLLDWSEDAYTSLYFSLEKFVDSPDTLVEGDEDADAALYILDPMLYNYARLQMLKTLNTRPEEYSRTMQGGDGYIPNLSIEANRRQFSLFIPGGHEEVPPKPYYIVSRAPEEIELAEVAKDELYNLPLAIYTSRLNPRLRAQSGMFLSYNLRSVPVWPQFAVNPDEAIRSAKLFHYMSLEAIQRYYLSEFPFEDPFLLKLNIDKQLKRELGDMLRYLGMNRYRIYPELEQLAKTR